MAMSMLIANLNSRQSQKLPRAVYRDKSTAQKHKPFPDERLIDQTNSMQRNGLSMPIFFVCTGIFPCMTHGHLSGNAVLFDNEMMMMMIE